MSGFQSSLIGMARAADWAHVDLAPLHADVFGGVAVILSPVADLGRLHHQLVVAACRRGPFLPAKAGQIWTGEQRNCWHAPDVQQAFLQQLDLVAGCIEITVQMSLHEPAQTGQPVRDGRLYLRQRQSALSAAAAVEMRLGRLADRIIEATGTAVRSSLRTMSCENGLVGLMLALLVPRSMAAALVPDIDTLTLTSDPDVVVRIDGPWPTYHFAMPALADMTGALAA